MTIRIGILGYGNLGRGVEYAVAQNPDMELAAVFTRRGSGFHDHPHPRRAGSGRQRCGKLEGQN